MAIHDLTQAHVVRKSLGSLARLRSNTSGNAMAMIAMAMIPLTAMIGSGVDMSRAYLTQARLQQACDAGALAIRRNMTGNALTTADITEGRKFFDFNFPSGTYDVSNLTFNAAQVSGSNAISITAGAKMPNKVMMMFGFENQQINVNCNASQDFVNTDVTFVLDVTGSMADPTSDGIPKITGLRNAVLSFYDELKPAQDALEAKGLRLRYSFVPYSSTVNVGKLLYAKDPGSLNLNAKYRTNKSTSSTWYPNIDHNASPYPAGWVTSAAYTGCIEERKTINVGTSGSLDIQSGT